MDTEPDLLIGGEMPPLGMVFGTGSPPSTRREARAHMRELIRSGANPEVACALACHAAALLDPEDSRVLEAVEQWDDLALARVVTGDRSVKLHMISDWLGTDRVEALGRVIDEFFITSDPNRHLSAAANN